MMNLKRHALAALVLTASMTSAALATDHYTGMNLASHAKVTISQARAIALKALPGARIVAEELEQEKGGSGYRFSFDMIVKNVKHEVGVDAVTGKVLENGLEQGADSDKN